MRALTVKTCSLIVHTKPLFLVFLKAQEQIIAEMGGNPHNTEMTCNACAQRAQAGFLAALEMRSNTARIHTEIQIKQCKD